MFTPLGSNKSLTQQVDNELTEAIRAGKYLPGNKIPSENELCEIFNVSRTSIREAVKKMSARGIVDVKRGSGVYVSEMSIKNTSENLNLFFELSSDENIILQTINTRLIIEPAIASQAAIFRNHNHIALLKANMIKMRKCNLDNKKREAELDNDFHKILLSIVNNKVLDLLISPIFNLIPNFKTAVFAKPIESRMIDKKNIMLDHHEKILEAIINKDNEKSHQAMREHILETQNNYTKSLQKK